MLGNELSDDESPAFDAKSESSRLQRLDDILDEEFEDIDNVEIKKEVKQKNKQRSTWE